MCKPHCTEHTIYCIIPAVVFRLWIYFSSLALYCILLLHIAILSSLKCVVFSQLDLRQFTRVLPVFSPADISGSGDSGRLWLVSMHFLTTSHPSPPISPLPHPLAHFVPIICFLLLLTMQRVVIEPWFTFEPPTQFPPLPLPSAFHPDTIYSPCNNVSLL